jgi:hypothetical protein
MPTAKKIPTPTSANTNAVALETDINDKSAVVERTTRTRRLVPEVGIAGFITGLMNSTGLRSGKYQSSGMQITSDS